MTPGKEKSEESRYPHILVIFHVVVVSAFYKELAQPTTFYNFTLHF
jgi:hypothetical protein